MSRPTFVRAGAAVIAVAAATSLAACGGGGGGGGSQSASDTLTIGLNSDPAPGGYAGWRATTAFSRRFGNAWLGAFVRYDNLHGAQFAPSPLVRKETTVTAGFGISWIFATSSQRVLTDD